MLDCIKSQIDSHEIISFDIFDTLLLRPYLKPTDLFWHIEKMCNISGFANARIIAEKKARKNHKEKEDITFDEIYAEIEDIYKPLKSKEETWEYQVLQPNAEMKEVFDYAKSQNKKIIITSDMYLSTDFLAKTLIDKGFAGFDEIYVSSDVKKTKYTGNLYNYVCNKQGVTPPQSFVAYRR